MAAMKGPCTPERERNDEESSHGRCGDRQENGKITGEGTPGRRTAGNKAWILYQENFQV